MGVDNDKLLFENILAAYDDIYNRIDTKLNLMIKNLSLEKTGSKDILQEIQEYILLDK